VKVRGWTLEEKHARRVISPEEKSQGMWGVQMKTGDVVDLAAGVVIEKKKKKKKTRDLR